jgi:hypothetical protein
MSSHDSNGRGRWTFVNYLNILLLAYCAFVVIGSVWDIVVVRQRPVAFTLIESFGFLSGGVGVFLYFNGRRIWGLVGIVGQLASYVVSHVVFRTSIVKNLFFWIFLCVFVGFIVNLIVRGRSKGSTTASSGRD